MRGATESGELVVIGARQSGDNAPAKSGISRRSFIKALGSASAVGAVGCADRSAQKVFPHVHGQNEEIPGVATWYRSTCTECQAGCGIEVRVREGRAVKIEGSRDNPINHGGLCGLGQSALQHLYDPDRIRQPLVSKDNSQVATSWEAALSQAAAQLSSSKGRVAIVTSVLHGAQAKLMGDFAAALRARWVQYDPLEQQAFSRASKLVYGIDGLPRLRLDRSRVTVNLGADFLETWISPVEFAKQWAATRRAKHPTTYLHFEPRLSLTGANADRWYRTAPGGEQFVALGLLKLLVNAGLGENLSERVRSGIARLVEDVELSAVVEQSGVSEKDLRKVAEKLRHAAGHSLVIAGGVGGASQFGEDLQVFVAFINLVLGNVGETVLLSDPRAVPVADRDLAGLTKQLKSGRYDVLLVDEVNPAYFTAGGLRFAETLKGVKHLLALSSHPDETTKLASVVLPTHVSLESWGDREVLPGVHSLVQPVMVPVFDTRDFGDLVIELLRRVGAEGPIKGAADFQAYLKQEWRSRYASVLDFETFWRNALERGGVFSELSEISRVPVRVSEQALNVKPKRPEFSGDAKGLVLYPYSSIKTFDGRAANRPWLQELPDPVTKIVWDAWAEIHPDTAKGKGIQTGDVVELKSTVGSITVPAYVTEFVAPDLVAVPLGQGHQAFGRYAQAVSDGNPLALLQDLSSNSLDLLQIRVLVSKAPKRTRLVNLQGSDRLHGRDKDIARTALVSAAAKHGADHGHGDGHAGHHHEPKQMYEQREHPLYRWGMAVDLAACNGCSACVVACYAENNIPVVGKEVCDQGREMSWLRIERYYDGTAEELQVKFLPMMCQHCNNAPCEPVCPVYATYHNEEGLNAMIYNRCVGTRYCSNNCSYKVRRFNWFEFDAPEPSDLQLNPDVTKRAAGVMEKCSFCVQRINAAKDTAKDEGRMVRDGEVEPACVQSCPTQALVFGDLNDPKSKVSKWSHSKRAYRVLDHHLNTQPAVAYLEDKRVKV